MGIKAVIFDLDGVVCHTDRYHFMAWKAVADAQGLPFDERLNDRLRGVGRMESLELILRCGARRYTPEEKRRMAEEKNQIYRALLETMTPADLAPETRVTLLALRHAGLLLAIGSSSKNTGLILERLGLEGFFDAVADGGMVSRAKPDPEVFLLAASLLGVDSAEALVVEDARAGVAAARAGGFPCAGIGDAALCRETDYPIRALAELKQICAVA